MSSTAGMATIYCTLLMGSEMSSIAEKAGTNTLLTRSTMWTAVARSPLRYPQLYLAPSARGYRAATTSSVPTNRDNTECQRFF